MPKVVQGKQELGTRTYDVDNARKELAKAIVMHEYPLSLWIILVLGDIQQL